ncbi:MAG: putative 4-hydroxy-4-methyl-2-oxoglutarate aldolase, partial [Craterilacuibacter sp.]
IYGCIRDSVAIKALDLGVQAIATNPKKSVKRGEGQRDLPVHFAAITFTPGEWLYADEDGILLSATPLR